eukprot:g76234.t1
MSMFCDLINKRRTLSRPQSWHHFNLVEWRIAHNCPQSTGRLFVVRILYPPSLVVAGRCRQLRLWLVCYMLDDRAVVCVSTGKVYSSIKEAAADKDFPCALERIYDCVNETAGTWMAGGEKWCYQDRLHLYVDPDTPSGPGPYV